MKKQMITMGLAAAMLLGAGAAHAGNMLITCGKKNVRVNIVAQRADLFSTPVIKSILVDGKPSTFRRSVVQGDEFAVSGFGYKGYESIKVTLSQCNDGNSIVGKAIYNWYNSSMPMNPMSVVNLDCTCKAN